MLHVGRFKIGYRIAGDYEFIVRTFHSQEVRYHHLLEVLVNIMEGGAGGFGAMLRLNREVLRACRVSGFQSNVVGILSKYPAKILYFQ